MLIKDAQAGTLAHHLCACWVSVCSELVEMNQIVISF